MSLRNSSGFISAPTLAENERKKTKETGPLAAGAPLAVGDNRTEEVSVSGPEVAILYMGPAYQVQLLRIPYGVALAPGIEKRPDVLGAAYDRPPHPP